MHIYIIVLFKFLSFLCKTRTLTHTTEYIPLSLCLWSISLQRCIRAFPIRVELAYILFLRLSIEHMILLITREV